MKKRDYNRLKRRKGKLLRQEERAWKGKAQSYDAIMFGPVLERTTRLERFRAQKPALNPDGKPAHVHSVGVCHTIIATLYAHQRQRDDDKGDMVTNAKVNRYLQRQSDIIRARLPR